MSRLSKDRVSELKTITACVESFDSIEDASLDFVATLSGGIRDLLADREAILAELKLAEGLSVKFHDEWLKSQAELAACQDELKLWKPMTPEEAEAALDAAIPIPISDEEIDRIVAKVTDPAYRPPESEQVLMAAKIEQQRKELAACRAELAEAQSQIVLLRGYAT